MSTSFQEHPFDSFTSPARAELPGWRLRNRSPVRGLMFIAATVLAVVGIAMNYELVWELLAQFIPSAFDTVVELLNAGFQLVGLPPVAAQMATVYVGLVLFLVLLYILVRKSRLWLGAIRQTVDDYRDMYADLTNSWTRETKARLHAWWQAQDLLGKIAAVVGVVLILIPVFIAVSVGLGMLVAMLL